MDEVQPKQANVHGHCWPFHSLVLSGSLVEETYCAIPGDDVDEYEFYDSGTPMRHAGRVSLIKTAVVQYATGDRYHRSGSELHVAYPARPRTVTALAHTLFRSHQTKVYVRDSRVGPAGTSRAISRGELDALVELLQGLRHGNPYEATDF
jgi:hypothetical protein